MTDRILAAALEYGRLGYRVFPLAASRMPIPERWPERATADPEAIERLWAEYPDAAGIGILTGGDDNPWAVDLDVKNGKRGDDEMAALVARHGPLPDTVTARTGTGGSHLYWAPNPRIKNSEGKIAPGIDVRGWHGYVVAPPTRNLDVGKRYEFEIGFNPRDIRPAPAPDWLIDLALHAGNGTRKTAQTPGAPIPDGARNGTLASIAGSMRHIGLSEAAIASALVEVNRERCKPPLPDPDVFKIARSIARYPAGENGQRPPVADPTWLRIEEVQPGTVTWLWRPYIPLGKLTLLDGDPGEGKTTVLLDIAARVTTGFEMPDHSSGCSAAGVVLLSAEDGIGDTIRPRLEAAGADLSRINAFSFEHDITLPDNVDIVRAAARDVGARLVIIDPLMAYLSPKVNAHRDQDVRRALKQLSELAADLDAAVVVIRHLTKQPGANPLYRGGGSIGITGAARSVLLAASDGERPGSHVLAPLKNNLAHLGPALGYCLESSDPTNLDAADRVRWLGVSELTAGQLLGPAASEKERGEVEKAMVFLAELLEDGEMPVKELYKERDQADFSRWSFRAAKDRLGILARKDGFQGQWHWRLPTDAKGSGTDRHQSLRTTPYREGG
jgi:hypothetical protein